MDLRPLIHSAYYSHHVESVRRLPGLLALIAFMYLFMMNGIPWQDQSPVLERPPPRPLMNGYRVVFERVVHEANYEVAVSH